MIRTGIFSGSFNPVHIGHLALANWICEYGGIDELWFLVTPQNPLKKGREMIDYRTRFEMLQAAVADYPHFRVSDFELGLPQPAYTIQTLHALRESYPDRRFYLVIGADNWQSFDRWKDAKTLIDEFPILIYPRPGYELSIPPELKNVSAVAAPLIEISSSFIRTALRQGRDIRFFLPEPVRAIIGKIDILPE
ncbi:MAG: nicotinate-nucleotide adenylyltransferase [Tannerella sp.]|jgi:nicotinate-nucleotide adenylyltransferase|nr:nicotinate-nucleotide adenylyltransferase [Tannerella sp.]